MSATTFEHLTDIAGMVLAIVMVALFAVVDLVSGRPVVRRVSGVAAGSIFTILMAMIAVRFAVLAT